MRDDDEVVERTHGEYVVSTDRSRIDVAAVHEFLTNAHWSPGIPESVVRRGIAGSICFEIYCGEEQVEFARVIKWRSCDRRSI